jgi:hypothetical protein
MATIIINITFSLTAIKLRKYVWLLVGWANGFIVNPTFLAYFMLGCQKDGSPTYDNNLLT